MATIEREQVSASITRSGDSFSIRYQGAGDDKTYRIKFNEAENSFEGDYVHWWWQEAIRQEFGLPDSLRMQRLYQDIIPLAEAEKLWGKVNLRQDGVPIAKWKLGRNWVTTRSEMVRVYGEPTN